MAFASYDWNAIKKCHEWTIHMYGRRLCCAINEITAHLTALALNELRSEHAPYLGQSEGLAR